MSGSVDPDPDAATTRGRRTATATVAAAADDRRPVVDPAEVTAEVETLSAEEAIAWAIERFHPRLRFAASFQKTSSVMVDIAHRIDPGARFFYLDTDLLFPETYDDPRRARRALRDRVRALRRICHRRSSPASAALISGAVDPDACCGIRKVEPMRTALDEVELLGLGNSQSRLGDPRRRTQVRLGRAVRALEAEPARRLG